MRNVLICDRYRPILIYLILYPNILEDTILISNDNFINQINTDAFKDVILYKKELTKYKILDFAFKFFYVLFKRVRMRKFFSDKILFGQRHVLGMGFSNKKILDIEDGYQNYNYNNSLKRRFRELIYNIPSTDDKRIIKRIRTKELEKDTYVISLSDEWKKLDIDKKGKILSVFKITLIDLEIYQNKIVILSQPLSEDGIISESDKISLYKDICEKYRNSNRQVIIKKHPRERTLYGFSDVLEVSKVFPIELVALIEVKPSHVITLYSTAIDDFEKLGVECTTLGKEYINRP